jgi:hypothetical protein
MTITLTREEAQQVLDALEKIIQGCKDVERDEHIHKDGKDLARLVRIDCRAPAEVLRERLSKRDWKGLTKDEISNWDLPDSPTVYEFAQFVEAKLKEKNT